MAASVAEPAMRFAFQRLGKPLMNLFKGASKGDLALRFGPDVGYAALASTLFAPENASLGERLAMGGEDLVYGIGSSLLGQGIGRGIGRRKAADDLISKRRRKAVPGDLSGDAQARQDYANTVNSFQTGGDVLGQMAMVALPRPVTQGVYEAAGERANQTAQQVNAATQEMLEEQQLAIALGQLIEGGYLAGNSIGLNRGTAPLTPVA